MGCVSGDSRGDMANGNGSYPPALVGNWQRDCSSMHWSRVDSRMLLPWKQVPADIGGWQGMSMEIECSGSTFSRRQPKLWCLPWCLKTEDSLAATSTLLRCSMQLCRLFSRLLVV